METLSAFLSLHENKPQITRLDRDVTVRQWCISLQWRHNEPDGVSNQQPHDCLFNRLFRRRSKKTSKLRVTGLCAGNSPGTGEFPAQIASNPKNVSPETSNGSWCMGVKGEMSGTVCVTFTWDIYIYIWVVYSFCLFCCLFIVVTWWYVWCIEWASGNQKEV